MIELCKIFWTCAKLKLNLIGILQFAVHLKSADMYVMLEIYSIVSLAFMIFSVGIDKACPDLNMGENQIVSVLHNAVQIVLSL